MLPLNETLLIAPRERFHQLGSLRACVGPGVQFLMAVQKQQLLPDRDILQEHIQSESLGFLDRYRRLPRGEVLQSIRAQFPSLWEEMLPRQIQPLTRAPDFQAVLTETLLHQLGASRLKPLTQGFRFVELEVPVYLRVDRGNWRSNAALHMDIPSLQEWLPMGDFFCFGRSDIEQTLELDYRGSIEQFSQGLLLIYDDLIRVLRGGLSWVVETYCQTN